MITYNNINQEYVPSVDLKTLGDTFNTLEKGHQEAVKAESELKTAIGNLPMNEQEEYYKDMLVQDIKTTVDNNTIYGNKYGALDDLTLKIGDIMANPDVRGRIEAQERYTKYMDTIDSFDIPESYKNMYRELNKYTPYKDRQIVNGEVIEGKGWEPKSRPVKTINFSKLLQEALNVTRKETGNYNNVTFLDANGKPTNDVSKSFDGGGIYQQTNVGWERIPIDKLMASINHAINNTPGAKESLLQDFNYLVWNKNKYGLNEENKIAFEDNGSVLKFNDYLKRRIDPFIKATTGTNYTSKVTYGDALKDYSKYKLALSENNTDRNYLNKPGAAIVGSFDIGVPAYQQANNTKLSADKSFMDLMKTLDPNGVNYYTDVNTARNYYGEKFGIKNIGPGNMVNHIVKTFNPNLSNEDKLKLHNAAMSAYTANANMNKLLQSAGDNADGLRFGSNIIDKKYTNDNEYGKDINDIFNVTFVNDDDTFEYVFGENIYHKLCELYGVKDLKEVGLDYAGSSEGNYELIFNKDNKNELPRFASTIRKADDLVDSGFWSGVKNAFGDVDSGNYKVRLNKSTYSLNFDQGSTWLSKIGDMTPYSLLTGDWQFDKKDGTYSTHKILADIYDKGHNAYQKAQTISNTKVRAEITTTDADGVKDLELRQQRYTFGSETEYNNRQKEAKQHLDNLLQHNLYSAGQIYIADENGHYGQKLEENIDIQTLIGMMYTSYPDKVKRSYQTVPLKGKYDSGTSLEHVYFLNFTVPTNLVKDGDPLSKYSGKLMKVAIAGSLDEGTDYDPTRDPVSLSSSLIDVATKTKTDAKFIPYDTYLGDSSVTPKDDGSYDIHLASKTINVGLENAIYFGKSLMDLNTIKYKLNNKMYANKEQANKELGVALNNLLASTNNEISEEVLKNIVINYMRNKDE